MTDPKQIERILARSKAGRRAVTVRMADVEPEEVEWLWYPYIPSGKLTLLEGDPGLGKTFLALQIAATVTRGDTFPGEPEERAGVRQKGSVIYLSAEDGLADTLRPRLDAVRADVNRIYALTGARIEDKDEPREVAVTLADVAALEDAIARHEPAMVVVDPLQAYLGSEVDMHRSNETRPVLAGIARLAERYGCAVLLIRHLSKAQQKVMYRGQGSIDIVAAARSGLLVGEHPNAPGQRVLAHFKSSLAPEGPSLAFEIREGAFLWVGRVNVSAEQLGAPLAGTEDRDAVADAKDFLLELLKDGPIPVSDIEKEAKAASVAKKTVERGKRALGITSHRRSFGNTGNGQWVWALPNTSADKRAPNPARAALRDAEEAPSETTSAQERPTDDEAVLREGPAARDKSVDPQDRLPGVRQPAQDATIVDTPRPELDTCPPTEGPS